MANEQTDGIAVFIDQLIPVLGYDILVEGKRFAMQLRLPKSKKYRWVLGGVA